MPVVKINAIEVPPNAGPELEKRFAHRAHAVDNQPGFLGFQLLRPVKGETRYFVVTQWESEEAFQAWATGPAIEAHKGEQRNPVATGQASWSSRLCWTLRGRATRRSPGRALRPAAGLTAVMAVVAALACGCSERSAPAAEVSYGAHIDTNTPPGLRAKQTMDMLNSDWPIGPVSVGTLASPEKIDDVGVKMDTIWWDRPFKVTSVEIGAGQATLHVLTSYNVAQNIELRTNDAGLADRFEVNLEPPVINGWSDIDKEIAKTGARYSYQVSRCVPAPRPPTRARWSRAPTPTCRCLWRRSSNSMCCLRSPTRSKRAR